MTQEQQEQLEKFKTMSRWMYEDAKESTFAAHANFLVAMGVFNYIETLGTFLIGYFQKDTQGNILKDRNGRDLKTSTKDRFNTFFGYMGQEYSNLLTSYPETYDELRCGLTHEYLPKNRRFSIAGVDRRFTDIELDHLMSPIDGSLITCGVSLFSPHDGGEIWFICNGKLLIDFQRAVGRLIQEIENEQNLNLSDKFFETADQINLEAFK